MDTVKRWVPLLGTLVLVVQTIAALAGADAIAAVIGQAAGLTGFGADAEAAGYIAVLGAAVAGAGFGLFAKVRSLYLTGLAGANGWRRWWPLASVGVLVATHAAKALGYVEVAGGLEVLARIASLQADAETVAAVGVLSTALSGAGVGLVRKVRAQLAAGKRTVV